MVWLLLVALTLGDIQLLVLDIPDTLLGYLSSWFCNVTTPWMIPISSVFLIIVCVGLQSPGDGLAMPLDLDHVLPVASKIRRGFFQG